MHSYMPALSSWRYWRIRIRLFWYNNDMRIILYILLLSTCSLPSWLLAETIIRYQVTGIKGETLTNVQTSLQAAKKSLTAKKSDGLAEADIKRILYDNDSLIKTALQPYGYFNPTITHGFKQMEPNEWQLSYKITLGAPIRLSQIRVRVKGDGSNNTDMQRWRKAFPLKVGDVFNNTTYENGKQSFFSVANQEGYIHAKLVKHTVTIDLNSYTASLRLIYNTGPQYFYGPINLQKTRLNNSFLRKFLRIKQGEAYSIPRLLTAQRNLSNSGYFSDVSIKQGKVEATSKQIPLALSFTPIKKMQYLTGLGYGTDTGYRGQLGWNWRLINSHGQHASTYYNLSQIGSSFGTTYYIPGYDPINEQYALSANTASYKTDAGKSNLQRYGILFTKNKGRWQFMYGVSYQQEKFALTGKANQKANLLMPAVTWLYLHTDNALKPNYGERISVNIQGADKHALSDVSFVQYRVEMRALIPISYRNRFKLESTIGGTFTDNFDLLPLSLRFTAGGAQSVRGYAYQSLGPAKHLLVLSAEYQYRVVGDWFGSYFQDAGNAFNSDQHIDLKRSQGVGVVWQSPIGTMELDYAQSLTDPSKKPMLQFSMGGLL